MTAGPAIFEALAKAAGKESTVMLRIDPRTTMTITISTSEDSCAAITPGITATTGPSDTVPPSTTPSAPLGFGFLIALNQFPGALSAHHGGTGARIGAKPPDAVAARVQTSSDGPENARQAAASEPLASPESGASPWPGAAPESVVFTGPVDAPPAEQAVDRGGYPLGPVRSNQVPAPEPSSAILLGSSLLGLRLLKRIRRKSDRHPGEVPAGADGL